MRLFGAAAAATGVAAAGIGGTAYYFYNRTMKRCNAKVERTMKMSGTDWGAYSDFLKECREYMDSQESRDEYITSGDGLKLHGTFFPNHGSKKVALCFHGYTSKGTNDYVGLSGYYLKKGYAMLLPDARAHGESEGTYIGFGCLDRWDGLKWIEWLIETLGEDIEIVLHGDSMGGATVLMMSGLDLPKQVKGIISDCAFTSPKEVFTHVLNSMYHMPAFPLIPISDYVNKKKAGYGMDECNAAREVKKAKVPILFIHGSKDTFVPAYMCDELYDACRAPKMKLIIEGAAHCESFYKEPEKYTAMMDKFFATL